MRQIILVSSIIIFIASCSSLNYRGDDATYDLDDSSGQQGEDITSSNPLSGGALTGERYRVLISTDIGGSDEDDDQSMVHYLLYSDLFDTEGIISSPPHDGRMQDIIEVIDVYAQDYQNLKKHSETFPEPNDLKSVVKQGAIEAAPEQGYSRSTEGSDWIIQCAKRDDPRPLYVLVWGSVTDVAQALHDDPSIKEKIRVHFIASWNREQDPYAFRYIDQHHQDLWMIRNETTFRGWYMGGEQSGDLGNESFIDQHIAGHGALGDYFAPLKDGSIKMGDTPTVAYLLRGNPAEPSEPHWGGRFRKVEGRPHWWTDIQNPALTVNGRSGAITVARWREAYLRDFQKRMDWCK